MLLFQIPVLPEFLLGRRNARGVGELIRRTSRDPKRFPDEVLEVYRRNARRPGGLRAMLNWYRALIRAGGWRRQGHASRRIETPALLIWGDADAALSIRTTRGTEAYVSDLTLRVLPGVSHWVQQEAPEQVNAILEAWLTGARVPRFMKLDTHGKLAVSPRARIARSVDPAEE
jgi:pimeloyl-ACP methyl ester carboxylesterase